MKMTWMDKGRISVMPEVVLVVKLQDSEIVHIGYASLSVFREWNTTSMIGRSWCSD